MLICLHSDIYPAEAIEQAVDAYRGVAKFSVKKQGKYIRLAAKDTDKSEDAYIRNEFCNYILAQIKNWNNETPGKTTNKNKHR